MRGQLLIRINTLFCWTLVIFKGKLQRDFYNKLNYNQQHYPMKMQKLNVLSDYVITEKLDEGSCSVCK